MTTKVKIPKIRFKEFSGEWKEKKLGDFSNISKLAGFEFTEYVNYSDTGNIIALRGLNIKNNTLDLSDVKYIDNSDFSKLNRSKLYVDDLMFTYVGTIGETALIKENDKYYLAPNVARVRFKNNIANPIFINQYFNNSKFQNQEITKYITSSSQPALSMENIRKFQIFLPSLPEQQKIASFLSLVDEKIEKIKEKKKNIEEYKKGVMQKIFSQEIRFKDENGEEFGEWEDKSFGEICEKQSSNISANTLENNTGNYKIYGATGFLKFIDFYQEENDYISIVKDGAGVGRVLYCEGKSSVLGTLDKIKPKKGTNLYFLLSILRNIDFVKYTIGSTIPHIYFKDYGKEKFLFPTLKEQEKIADFLSGIDEKIEKVIDELGKMEEFKKGLLQGMFV